MNQSERRFSQRLVFCRAHDPRVLARFFCAVVLLGGLSSQSAVAQETPPNLETAAPAPEATATPSPETPAASETIAAEPPAASQAPPAAPEVPLALSVPSQVANATRLYAESWKLQNGVIVAEGSNERGVRLETDTTRIYARRIELDVQNRTARAIGRVLVERTRAIERADLRASAEMPQTRSEVVIETLRGDNFQYDFNTKKGRLDNTFLQLANFNVEATDILINGKRYEARNVLLRPGALTEAERKIYGTPPFNLRAKTVIFEQASDASARASNSTGADSGGPEVGNTGTSSSVGSGAGLMQNGRTTVRGAAFYYKNTRLFPVPSAILRRIGGGARDPQAYTLTPRISFNDADGLLLTGQLRYPLGAQPDGTTLTADLGVSTRVGFRGGAAIETPTRVGDFSLGYRRNDVVTTQLTNRIVLDREPEVTYSSPRIGLFSLPGGRRAALKFSAGYGRFTERQIGENNSRVEATRGQGTVRFTTRGGENTEGPYLDLFARIARYSDNQDRYRNAGYEIGYIGQLVPRVRGQVSYSSTTLSGKTPFRFDRVEIERELRTTLDFELSPRYLLPVDLRYDVKQKRLRDSTFGILRNYKTFAYGVVYQTSRKELKLEFRNGF